MFIYISYKFMNDFNLCTNENVFHTIEYPKAEYGWGFSQILINIRLFLQQRSEFSGQGDISSFSVNVQKHMKRSRYLSCSLIHCFLHFALKSYISS